MSWVFEFELHFSGWNPRLYDCEQLLLSLSRVITSQYILYTILIKLVSIIARKIYFLLRNHWLMCRPVKWFLNSAFLFKQYGQKRKDNLPSFWVFTHLQGPRATRHSSPLHTRFVVLNVPCWSIFYIIWIHICLHCLSVLLWTRMSALCLCTTITLYPNRRYTTKVDKKSLYWRLPWCYINYIVGCVWQCALEISGKWVSPIHLVSQLPFCALSALWQNTGAAVIW